MIKIQKDKPVLLIDLSYYLIYRYFALMSWFKISQTEYNEAILLTKYEDIFIKTLHKIIKKLKCEAHNTVLVGDCCRNTIWRNSIYPDYKGTRSKQHQDNPINEKIFPLIYEKILPNLENIQYICINELEADDVIYGITKKIENNIFILSNDNDYLQLIDDRVSVFNLPSLKSIGKRSIGCPKKDLLMKILTGDVSDNIQGVVSKKTCKTLLEKSLFEIEEYLDSKNLLSQYKMNSLLIDMNNIPQDLLDTISLEIYIH